MPENQKEQAQQVLDQLWNEQLIPFPLTIGKITKNSDGSSVHFFDSRIRTAQICLSDGETFTDRVRAAVLKRVAKMSGPLSNWHPEKATAAKGSF